MTGPDSLRRDRFDKRRLYQAERVPLSWLINLAARAAEVWTPDLRLPTVEAERLTWLPAGADTPFAVALDELFAEP